VNYEAAGFELVWNFPASYTIELDELSKASKCRTPGPRSTTGLIDAVSTATRCFDLIGDCEPGIIRLPVGDFASTPNYTSRVQLELRTIYCRAGFTRQASREVRLARQPLLKAAAARDPGQAAKRSFRSCSTVENSIAFIPSAIAASTLTRLSSIKRVSSGTRTEPLQSVQINFRVRFGYV
jgi:hypothetical protein